MNKVTIFNEKILKSGVKLCKTLVTGALIFTVSATAFLVQTSNNVRKNNAASLEREAENKKTQELVIETEYSEPKIIKNDGDPLYFIEKDDFKETNRINTPVNMGDEDLTEFTTYLDSFETEYPYSELFGIEAALESEAKYKGIEKHRSNIRVGDTLDVDVLTDVIIKNNEKYYEEIGSMRAFYRIMERADIRAVCEIIVNTINEVAEKQDIDLDRIACSLSEYKMFHKSGAAQAAISNDGVISINPNMIKFGQVIAQEGDNFGNTIKHEILHIIQKDCLENVENQRVGLSYRDESLPINPLYHSWLFEASAEKCRMNLNGEPNVVYDAQIGYLESLGFVFALRDDYAISDLENLSLTRDTDRFYSLFDLPKEEAVKLLYTVEIIQAEPEEFKNVFESSTGKELTQEKLLEIKRVLKGSFEESLAKMFYRNLALKINEGNVTLEDAFYLIKIFEADMFGHIRYDNEAKLELAATFLKNYMEIQEMFFRMIKVSNMPYEDIVSYFEEYSMRVIYNGKEISENYSLNWLPSDKKEYIQKCQLDVYSKTALSPRTMVDSLSQKNFN